MYNEGMQYEFYAYNLPTSNSNYWSRSPSDYYIYQYGSTVPIFMAGTTGGQMSPYNANNNLGIKIAFVIG
jgi:hypothetical protein